MYFAGKLMYLIVRASNQLAYSLKTILHYKVTTCTMVLQ